MEPFCCSLSPLKAPTFIVHDVSMLTLSLQIAVVAQTSGSSTTWLWFMVSIVSFLVRHCIHSQVLRIQQQSASRLYEIATSCGKVTADKIIVTAGAWANQVSSSIVVKFNSTSSIYFIGKKVSEQTRSLLIHSANPNSFLNQLFLFFLLQNYCPTGKRETEEHEKDNREQWEGGCLESLHSPLVSASACHQSTTEKKGTHRKNRRGGSVRIRLCSCRRRKKKKAGRREEMLD